MHNLLTYDPLKNCFVIVASVATTIMLCSVPCMAQAAPQPQNAQVLQGQIQAVDTAHFIFTDFTKTGAAYFQQFDRPAFKLPAFIYSHIPAKMFVSVNGQLSQRLETNVFQTASLPHADYGFRASPEVLVGYAGDKTGVYTDYLVLKDVFSEFGHRLNYPTQQTVTLGVYRDLVHLTPGVLRLDCQAREIWSAQGVRQANLLPGLYGNLKLPFGSLAASTQLQMVSTYPFEGATRAINPAYAMGFSKQLPAKVSMSLNDTLVTTYNYFKRPYHPLQMIPEITLSRPISTKLGKASWFIKAQPVFNWDSQRAPGHSGFDFRLWSGINIAFSKLPE